MCVPEIQLRLKLKYAEKTLLQTALQLRQALKNRQMQQQLILMLDIVKCDVTLISPILVVQKGC